MPKYRVSLSDGRTFDVEANAPPSEADVMAHLGASAPPAAAPTPAAPERSMLGDALEVGKGIVKGAVGTVAGLGEMAATSGTIPGLSARADLFNPSMRHPVFTRAEEATRAENPQQMAGKFAEGVAEMALPTGLAANAIPRAARAGAKFNEVANVANKMLVNTEAPGQAALKVMQLTEQGGGTLPRPVSQFLQWVTNPDKAPMDFEVARRFASGISRLSANEMMRMPPALAREVGELAATLSRSVAETASRAGKGREYSQAMSEYANAMKLRKMFSGTTDAFIQGAKQGLPVAGAAGAGMWLMNKLRGGD